MFKLEKYNYEKQENCDNEIAIQALKVKGNVIENKIRTLMRNKHSDDYLTAIYKQEFDTKLNELANQTSLSIEDLQNINTLACSGLTVQIDFQPTGRIKISYDDRELEVTNKEIILKSDNNFGSEIDLTFSTENEDLLITNVSLTDTSNGAQEDYDYVVQIESKQRQYKVILYFNIISDLNRELL